MLKLASKRLKIATTVMKMSRNCHIKPLAAFSIE